MKKNITNYIASRFLSNFIDLDVVGIRNKNIFDFDMDDHPNNKKEKDVNSNTSNIKENGFVLSVQKNDCECKRKNVPWQKVFYNHIKQHPIENGILMDNVIRDNNYHYNKVIFQIIESDDLYEKELQIHLFNKNK